MICEYVCEGVSRWEDEISISFSRLGKSAGSPQCEWALTNLLRAWIEKRERTSKFTLLSEWAGNSNSLFCLSVWAGTSILLLSLDWDSHHQYSWFLCLWTQNEIVPPAFLGTSEPILYNKFLYVYTYPQRNIDLCTYTHTQRQESLNKRNTFYKMQP